MSANAPSAHGQATDHSGHVLHEPSHYVKVWVALVILFGISVAGPRAGIPWLTLLTAFGIAMVKAYLVAAKFMHLNIEKRLAGMIIVSALACMMIFYFAVAPDVMRHEGQHWTNDAAKAETARVLKIQAAEEAQGGAHGAHPAEGHSAGGEHAAPAAH